MLLNLNMLKLHNQTKITFFYWILDMSIISEICRYVHWLFFLNSVLRIYQLKEKYGRDLIKDIDFLRCQSNKKN